MDKMDGFLYKFPPFESGSPHALSGRPVYEPTWKNPPILHFYWPFSFFTVRD